MEFQKIVPINKSRVWKKSKNDNRVDSFIWHRRVNYLLMNNRNHKCYIHVVSIPHELILSFEMLIWQFDFNTSVENRQLYPDQTIDCPFFNNNKSQKNARKTLVCIKFLVFFSFVRFNLILMMDYP